MDMEEERTYLSRKEVDGKMVPGESVHTFKEGGSALIGCDWKREDILKLIDEGNKAELSGEKATAMNHGVVVWDGQSPLFCATA